MADSSIEWTEKVWNPSTGCDRLSPGCDHCYALTMAKRLKAMGQAKYQRDGNPRTSGPGFGLSVHPDVLSLPLSWRKPTRIFVNSMSDLFHDSVPDEFIAEVFAVMAAAPQHTFQLLTKRHGRMRSLLNSSDFPHEVAKAWMRRGLGVPHFDWPLPSVWLGVSAENQQWADIRIPALLDTPAAVRWVSAEPLLGAVDFRDLGYRGGRGSVNAMDGKTVEFNGGMWSHERLDWVVVGGESGPGARPMDEAWVRSIVDQCRRYEVHVFVKQLGSMWAKANGGHLKGGDPSVWPADLRVREFPAVRSAI